MTQVEAEAFFNDANRRIDRHLGDRLRLLGITRADIADPVIRPTLNLKKNIIHETETEIKEEYACNGILLFWVIWSKDQCSVLDPYINEDDLPYIRD